MTGYQDRLTGRVRDAAGAAIDRVIVAAPPAGHLEDLIGDALHAAMAAAADVWGDALLYGDHPPTTGPGTVRSAGVLLVNPADYRPAS